MYNQDQESNLKCKYYGCACQEKSAFAVHRSLCKLYSEYLTPCLQICKICTMMYLYFYLCLFYFNYQGFPYPEAWKGISSRYLFIYFMILDSKIQLPIYIFISYKNNYIGFDVSNKLQDVLMIFEGESKSPLHWHISVFISDTLKCIRNTCISIYQSCKMFICNFRAQPKKQLFRLCWEGSCFVFVQPCTLLFS